jgi:hypothetical protein
MDLNKFKSNKEKFDYLVANKAEIIELKKSALKFSDSFTTIESEAITNKALSTTNVDDIANGVIKRTVIANTYNWLDSHGDVHLSGLFSKSIQERANKIWHLHDHEYKITSKVGKPESIYEKAVKWADLGIDKAGDTEALMMDSTIKSSLNAKIYKAYLDNEIDNHSVGMAYVKVELAINDSEYKEEYATFQKYIGQIGNKDQAEQLGYFYAIKEAKLIEISAVLEGSNSLTPTINNITTEIEPEQTTQEKAADAIINYNYLLNSFKNQN